LAVRAVRLTVHGQEGLTACCLIGDYYFLRDYYFIRYYYFVYRRVNVVSARRCAQILGKVARLEACHDRFASCWTGEPALDSTSRRR
jgi:hypothetical protein